MPTTTPMSTADSQSAHPRQTTHSRWLWFALFGGPAAWSIQLLVNYPLAAHFCYPRNVPLSAPTFGGLWTTLIVVNVLMLFTTLAAGAAAIVIWRSARDGAAAPHDPVLESGTGRVRYMAYAAMLFSGLFLIAILMSAMPLFIVPVCSYGA